MSFIDTLKTELNHRCKKNQGYSLRAYARDLGIDPSNMSKILSNKMNPQSATKEKLLLKIGIKPKEIKNIIKPKKPSFDEKFDHLELEEFEVVSEWYHDAILELTRLSFFKADINWISGVLSISKIQTKLAVERLEKLGFLEIKDKSWKDKSGNNTTNMNSNYTNGALKNLQISLLKNSISAVKNISVEQRDHSSTTLAINRKDIPEVKMKIKDFRKEMAIFLERKPELSDSLYQIHIGFYPILNQEKIK